MTTALYYAPDACSIAPHIVLREIAEPFELRKVSIMDKSNQKPEYLAINPKGRVPALLTEGTIVTENPAILFHLGRKYFQAGLMPPAGSLKEAKCVEMMSWLSNTVHVAFSQMVRPERFVVGDAGFPAVQDSGRGNFQRQLATIDDHLSRHRFAVGDQFTVADPYLLVFFRWGVRHAFDMKTLFPSYCRFVDGMYARPTVLAALEYEGLTTWPEQGPPPN